MAAASELDRHPGSCRAAGRRWSLPRRSPRRLALLAQIGIVPDAVIAPDIDETPSRAELPRPYAQRMAHAKAVAVPVPGHFVLAADTVACSAIYPGA